MTGYDNEVVVVISSMLLCDSKIIINCSGGPNWVVAANMG
jgi:hypothetical protein